jgi:hypothetical protein
MCLLLSGICPGFLMGASSGVKTPRFFVFGIHELKLVANH